MSFDVTSTKASAKIETRGNLTIDYGQSNNRYINSVYAYDGKTQISDSNNRPDNILRMEDDCYDVLMSITGNDGILEQKDLNRIDQVYNTYKNILFGINKENLKDGEVTVSFKNGYNLKINFQTDEEQKLEDKKTGYRAPYGEKKEYFRQDLIEKYKDTYDIKKEVCTNSAGQEYTIYKITPKKELNLSKLSSDLGIRMEDISDNNIGYGPYDYNGHAIGNKPMIGETIQIPKGGLGYKFDERNIFVQIAESIFSSK